MGYTTLHYTTLHYTTLYYTALHYTTLHYTTLHYTTLYYTTLHYITIHSAHTYPPLFRNSAFTSSTPLAFPPFNLLTAPNTSFILTSVSAFSNTLTFIRGLAVISA